MRFLFCTIYFLLSLALSGQSVTYDGGTPNRPTSITGLVVNGILYDVTFTYNIPIELSTGIPFDDFPFAAVAISDVLNTQNIDSYYTNLRLVREGNSPFKGFVVTTGPNNSPNNWLAANSDDLGNPPSQQDTAVAQFQAQDPPETIPIFSQWGLMILGLFLTTLGIISSKQEFYLLHPNTTFIKFKDL